MDLELERLREIRLKEMKEKQGFVDIRSVVDVRDSGIVRNKEVVSLSIPYWCVLSIAWREHVLATPILIGHICMSVLLRASKMKCIF